MLQVLNSGVFIICMVLLCLQNAKVFADQVNACFEGQFQCDNGQCIGGNQKCDSFKDCADGSDETFVQCYDFVCAGHRCSYGACVESSKWCDGKIDCWDGTDEYEFECSDDGNLFDTQIRGECRNEAYTQFQCHESKECLAYSELCDGVENCRDKSDETIDLCVGSMCPDGSFRCAYGACIAITAACNHVIDCRDGSDELPAICKKWLNISSSEEWDTPSWQFKPAPLTPDPYLKPTTTRKPQTAEKRCNVTGTGLRLRTMYNGLPYLGGGTVSHQTTVRLFCSQNHILQGSDVNTCDNGEWKAPWAECVKVCSRSLITNDPSIRADCSYNNNIIDCAADPLWVGSKATIKCAQGYKANRAITQGERICDSHGKWTRLHSSAKNIKCTPDCGRLFDTVRVYPWLISVFERMSYNKYIFRCLGAIIHPFYALTVGSCFTSSNHPSHTDYVIVLGNQSVGFNPTQEHGYDIRNIAKIEMNEFTPLALLRMINPFVLSAKERPICMKPFAGKQSRPKWATLGEPIVVFRPDKQIYSLTHFVDNNSLINMNEFNNKIRDELRQN